MIHLKTEAHTHSSPDWNLCGSWLREHFYTSTPTAKIVQVEKMVSHFCFLDWKNPNPGFKTSVFAFSVTLAMLNSCCCKVWRSRGGTHSIKEKKYVKIVGGFEVCSHQAKPEWLELWTVYSGRYAVCSSLVHAGESTIWTWSQISVCSLSSDQQCGYLGARTWSQLTTGNNPKICILTGTKETDVDTW